jgi:hypothetical protein
MLQDLQERGDGQARVTVDEMQHRGDAPGQKP